MAWGAARAPVDLREPRVLFQMELELRQSSPLLLHLLQPLPSIFVSSLNSSTLSSFTSQREEYYRTTEMYIYVYTLVTGCTIHTSFLVVYSANATNRSTRFRIFLLSSATISSTAATCFHSSSQDWKERNLLYRIFSGMV